MWGTGIWGTRCRAATGLAAAYLLAGSLGACAFLETSDDPSPSLSFLTPDGVTEGDINGTWRGPCLEQTPDSLQYLLDFLRDDFVLVRLDWSDVIDCSADPDIVTQYEGTLSIDGTSAVGWNPAAPDPIPATVVASTFTDELDDPADFGAGEVSEFTGVGLIVTTAAPEALYIGFSFDADLTLDGNGYPAALKADPYYRD